MTPIATRKLQDASTDSSIEVSIGAPEEVGANKWKTDVKVSGGGADYTQGVLGLDAFQSLQLAMECIRVHLRDKHPQASWNSPGSSGFSRVPAHYGPVVAGHLETLLDSQITFLDSLVRAGQFRNTNKP